MTAKSNDSRFEQAMARIDQLTFPMARGRLESVSRELDKQDISLQRSVQLRVYAQALGDHCARLLASSDQLAQMVVIDGSAQPAGIKPFEVTSRASMSRGGESSGRK